MADDEEHGAGDGAQRFDQAECDAMQDGAASAVEMSMARALERMPSLPQ